MKEIKPQMEYNDKNDENMAKRHAISDAFSVVKKYFVDYVIEKGTPPTLSDVLSNVKAKPVYGCS